MKMDSESRTIGIGWMRITSHAGLKTAMSIVLPILFCAGYFGLQRVSIFSPWTLPLSWLDRSIGFQPDWVYVYQSVYLFMPIAPWLAIRREDLMRYIHGFFLLSVISFTVFIFFPVEAPRPNVPPAEGMYAFLVRYEGKLNAFPSLHAGLMMYTALFGGAVLKGALSPGYRRAVTLGAVIWGVGILYATLATKQHYAVDLPAGIVLAWLCHRWAWRVKQGRVSEPPLMKENVRCAEFVS